MIGLKRFEEILEEICPLGLSRAYIAKGAYDNSGTLVRQSESVARIFFTLDLTADAVKEAEKLQCDTIVTHHPAIYRPLSSLDIGDPTAAALLAAIKGGNNVVSMHLNLDAASGGIDECFARGLGAKEFKTIEIIGDGVGYGKEFTVEERDFEEYAALAAKTFATKKFLGYGKGKVKKVASFCGGGAGDAARYDGDADLIVTSDCPHHAIREIIERGRKLLVLPHYAAENYGFEKFYENVGKKLGNSALCFFHTDKIYL